MTYLLISLALLACSTLMLRPITGRSVANFVMATRAPQASSSFRISNPVLGLVFVSIVFLLSSPKWGLALVTAVLLHETGRYLGHRISGHDDALFRPFPFLPLTPSSQKAAATDGIDALINLMGASFSLAPMVLIHSLVPFAGDADTPAFKQLVAIGQTIAAYNFFMLLPLWPLAGGNIAKSVMQALAPKAVVPFLLATSAVTAAAGFAWESGVAVLLWLSGGLVLVGIQPAPPSARPMTTKQALLVIACHVALLAAFFKGGSQLIIWLL